MRQVGGFLRVHHYVTAIKMKVVLSTIKQTKKHIFEVNIFICLPLFASLCLPWSIKFGYSKWLPLCNWNIDESRVKNNNPNPNPMGQAVRIVIMCRDSHHHKFHGNIYRLFIIRISVYNSACRRLYIEYSGFWLWNWLLS